MSDAIREIKEISQDSNGNYYDENDVILQKCREYEYKGSKFWIDLNNKIQSSANVKYVYVKDISNKTTKMGNFSKVLTILTLSGTVGWTLIWILSLIGADIFNYLICATGFIVLCSLVWAVGALLSSGVISVGVGYIDID